MQSQLPASEPGEELAEERWYAIYTKHQHEKSATSLLTRKGFEVLLPLYRSVHRWKDRNQPVELPLFPCYVFLRSSMERKLEILQTPGVFWLVGSGGHASTVPDSDIESIRKIIRDPTKIEPHPYLKSGDRVRVLAGPMIGLEGVLTRVKNRWRLVVAVELLQKAVAVEVDAADVERLAPLPPASVRGKERQPKVRA
jgi:transcription antitermination factor NusG